MAKVRRIGWAVVTRGKIQVWQDGQLGIWSKKVKRDDVASEDRVVKVEIREIR